MDLQLSQTLGRAGGYVPRAHYFAGRHASLVACRAPSNNRRQQSRGA